jgi:hypothetical protein
VFLSVFGSSVFQSTDFVFALRSLLLGSFYLKGIGSGPLIRRNNIFLFFFVGFCVPNKWLEKDLEISDMLFAREKEKIYN